MNLNEMRRMNIVASIVSGCSKVLASVLIDIIFAEEDHYVDLGNIAWRHHFRTKSKKNKVEILTKEQKLMTGCYFYVKSYLFSSVHDLSNPFFMYVIDEYAISNETV